MKKELKSMILAAVAALACGFSFTACSDIAVAEDGIANEDSRSAVIYVRKMTSDLNPGYGKAVYFTGTFEEGNDWTVAVRGTYEDGQWSYTVNTHRKSFEYKALIGDWDEGPVVTVEFPGLRKLGKAEHLSGYQGQPSQTYYYDSEDIQYGEVVYFKHSLEDFAVRGEYMEEYGQPYSPFLEKQWVYINTDSYYYAFYGADAYVGPYDLGEKIYPEFLNLVWEEGENHICE